MQCQSLAITLLRVVVNACSFIIIRQMSTRNPTALAFSVVENVLRVFAIVLHIATI